MTLFTVRPCGERQKKEEKKRRISTSLLPGSNSTKEDGEGEQMDSKCVFSVSSWQHLPSVQAGGTVDLLALDVGAEVVTGLDRLPASERDEPQEFPASATNFSERPLPGFL